MPYDKFGGYHDTQTSANTVNNNTWSNGSSSHDSRNKGGGHSSSGGSSTPAPAPTPTMPDNVTIEGTDFIDAKMKEIPKVGINVGSSASFYLDGKNYTNVKIPESGGKVTVGDRTFYNNNGTIVSYVTGSVGEPSIGGSSPEKQIANELHLTGTGLEVVSQNGNYVINSPIGKTYNLDESKNALNDYIGSFENVRIEKPYIPDTFTDEFKILTPQENKMGEIIFPQNTAGDNFSLAAKKANITPVEQFFVDSVFSPMMTAAETLLFKPSGEFKPVSVLDFTPVGIAKTITENIVSGKAQEREKKIKKDIENQDYGAYMTDTILGSIGIGNTLVDRIYDYEEKQGTGLKRTIDIASSSLVIPAGALGGTAIKSGLKLFTGEGIKGLASKNIPIISKTAKEFTETGIKGVAAKTGKTAATVAGNLVGYGTLVDMGQNNENMKPLNLRYAEIDDTFSSGVKNVNFGNSLLGGALNTAVHYGGGAIGGIGGFIQSIPNAAVGIAEGAKHLSKGEIDLIGASAINSVKNFGKYVKEGFTENPAYTLGDMFGFGAGYAGISNFLPKVKSKTNVITGKVDDRFTEVSDLSLMSRPLQAAIQAGNLKEGIVTGDARIMTAPSNILGITKNGIYTKGTKGTSKLGAGITNTNVGEITPNALFKGLAIKTNPDIVNGELKHGSQLMFLGDASDLMKLDVGGKNKVGLNIETSQRGGLEWSFASWKPEGYNAMYVTPVLFGAPSTSGAIKKVHGKNINNFGGVEAVVNMVLPYNPVNRNKTYSTLYMPNDKPYSIFNRKTKTERKVSDKDKKYSHVEGLETDIYNRLVSSVDDFDSLPMPSTNVLSFGDGKQYSLSPKQLSKDIRSISPENERMLLIGADESLILGDSPLGMKAKSAVSGKMKNDSRIINTGADMFSRFERIKANDFGRVWNFRGRAADKKLTRAKDKSIPQDVAKAGTLDAAFRLTELLFDKNPSDISTHNYPHVQRVYRNAKKLNEKQNYGISDDILWVASIMHDVGKTQAAEGGNIIGTDHARSVGFILNSGNSLDVRDYYTPQAAKEFEARLTPEELSQYNRFMGLINTFRQDGTLKEIGGAISEHTTNLKRKSDRLTRSKLSKVLSDADRIDLKRYNSDNPYWLPKKEKMFADMDIVSDIMYGKTAAEIAKESKSGAHPTKSTENTDTLVSGISEIYKAYSEKKPVDSYSDVYAKGANVAGLKPYYAADMSKAANLYAYAAPAAKETNYSYSGKDNYSSVGAGYSPAKKSGYENYSSGKVDYAGAIYGGRVNYASAPYIDYGITPNYQKVNYSNYGRYDNTHAGGSYAAMIGLGDATLDKKRKLREDRERKLKRKRVKKYKNYTTYTPIAHPFSLLGLENIKTGFKEQKWKGAVTVTDTYNEMLGINSRKVKGKLRQPKQLEDMFGIRQDLNKKRKTKKSKKNNRR